MTLKEVLENDPVQIIRLVWVNGHMIGNHFTKEEAIRQYGNRQFIGAYSESNGKAYFWIY